MRSSLLCVAAMIVLGCASAAPGQAGNGGWTKYGANPVLKPGRKKPGAPVGHDYYNLSDPCVVKVGEEFYMWYTSSGVTAGIPVNHCSISLAVSLDGISWEKRGSGPVLDADPGAWDAYAVETACVVLDGADAERPFKMWYAGRTKDVKGDPGYDIGYAWSADGMAWTKHPSPVLKRGSGGAWDNYFLEGPTVVMDDGSFKMWYAAMDAVADGQASDGKVCIGYAESVDGVEWERSGAPVLSVGGPGAWDSVTVQDPCVIERDGRYFMWYGGKSDDVRNYGQRIGFASSSDGLSWKKSDSNPVMDRGPAGSWDAVTARFGSLVLAGDTLRMWYTGMDKDYDPPGSVPDYWEIGYAWRTVAGGAVTE